MVCCESNSVTEGLPMLASALKSVGERKGEHLSYDILELCYTYV